MADDGLVDPRLGRRIIAETRLRRNELRIERAIKRALDVHKTKAMSALRSQHMVAAAPPDPFDLAFWDTSVVREVSPVIEDVLDGLAAGVLEFLALPPEVRAQILGAIDVESVAATFVDRVRTLGPSTADRVIGELSVGIGKGEGIDKLSKRISDSFAIASNNATRIVRTETHGAAETTTFKSAGAIADAGFGMTKTWLATRDARTRKTHVKANGQTVAFDEPFIVGDARLEFPGGDGPADEVIQCRCSVEYALA